MIIHDIMKKYTINSGKVIERKNFSSRMSIAAKNKGKIRLYTKNDEAGENKFFWCLSSWFDGDSLKSEYLSKTNV